MTTIATTPMKESPIRRMMVEETWKVAGEVVAAEAESVDVDVGEEEEVEGTTSGR